MRIGKTNNLAGVTRVRKNFLIAGEAGVENDLSTAARDGARGAALKDAPIFQRESRESVRNFGQRGLPLSSCKFAIHLVLASAAVSSEPKWSTGQYAKTARP
jgi:hypothetical protein